MLTQHVAGRTYNFDEAVGSGVGGGRGFLAPVDFALGSEGIVYVICKGFEFTPNTGVTKCTLDHQFLWEDRNTTFTAGHSAMPMSIAVDSNEDVYIADDYSNRIFIYDKDGAPVGFWPKREPIEPEVYSAAKLPVDLYLTKLRGGNDGDGELNGPSGIVFDTDDNLYVVDSHNHRVQKFSRDGKFLLKFGSLGSGEGQFNLPWGIALDQEGNVFVADWRNDRVQKFTADGAYLASFGSGSGDGELQRPTGVAIDKDGDVYVTDWGNDRLNIYAGDGQYVTSFYGDADKLAPAHQSTVDANPDNQKARKRTDLSVERPFWRPVAVNVDDEGRIMVLDLQRNRIQVYIKERDWLEAQFNL